MSTLAQGETLVVGSSITIRGTVISHEDLSVEGTVEGTIEAREHRLIVGSQGSVRADIESREVIILGSVCGNVEAVEKIEIHKDANLVGDVKTARIRIMDGAYFKGAVDITSGATGSGLTE